MGNERGEITLAAEAFAGVQARRRDRREHRPQRPVRGRRGHQHADQRLQAAPLRRRRRSTTTTCGWRQRTRNDAMGSTPSDSGLDAAGLVVASAAGGSRHRPPFPSTVVRRMLELWACPEYPARRVRRVQRLRARDAGRVRVPSHHARAGPVRHVGRDPDGGCPLVRALMPTGAACCRMTRQLRQEAAVQRAPDGPLMAIIHGIQQSAVAEQLKASWHPGDEDHARAGTMRSFESLKGASHGQRRHLPEPRRTRRCRRACTATWRA